MITINDVPNDTAIGFLQGAKAPKERVYVSRCDKWLGAFDNGRIVGIIGLLGKRIRCFYVLKEYRRQGIGDTLLSALMEQSSQPWYSAYCTEYSRDMFKRHGFKYESYNTGTDIAFMRYKDED